MDGYLELFTLIWTILDQDFVLVFQLYLHLGPH